MFTLAGCSQETAQLYSRWLFQAWSVIHPGLPAPHSVFICMWVHVMFGTTSVACSPFLPLNRYFVQHNIFWTLGQMAIIYIFFNHSSKWDNVKVVIRNDEPTERYHESRPSFTLWGLKRVCVFIYCHCCHSIVFHHSRLLCSNERLPVSYLLSIKSADRQLATSWWT